MAADGNWLHAIAAARRIAAGLERGSLRAGFAGNTESGGGAETDGLARPAFFPFLSRGVDRQELAPRVALNDDHFLPFVRVFNELLENPLCLFNRVFHARIVGIGHAD
jgi:hypothetical protein